MIDPSKMFASLLQSPLNFANMGGGASVGQTGGGAASMASMFSPAHMPWPLFAAAAQAQLAEMTAMKNAQLMHQQQQHTSTPTAASTPAVHMKPSPFMIASLLEAATHHQQQHNQQISPASQQTSREGSAQRGRVNGFSDDEEDDGDDTGSDNQTSGGGGKKARKARTIFTDKQLQSLEESFDKQKYLSVQDRMELAARMNLSDTQVKTWYQNRRTKWKRQTAVGMELLHEAGNFAAVQQLLRSNPYWATMMQAQAAIGPSGFGGQPPPGWPGTGGTVDLSSAPLGPALGQQQSMPLNSPSQIDKAVNSATHTNSAVSGGSVQASPSESELQSVPLVKTGETKSRKRRHDSSTHHPDDNSDKDGGTVDSSSVKCEQN